MAFGQYLGFIGGVIGAIIGGVLGAIGTYGIGAAPGAAIGFTIGSAIGGIAGQVFWPEKADINTPPPPQPHETRLQFSSWGMSIPIQYGSGRMAGNIIYMSDITETIERSKHRQDGVRYYEMSKTYTSTFAIAFCEGPVIAIDRIWMNNKVIADWRDINNPNYPAGDTGLIALNLETSIARSVNFFEIHLGSELQSADSTLSTLITSAETPAYRGICYIVFKDFPIGEFSGVPQIQVEISEFARLIKNWNDISYGGYIVYGDVAGYGEVLKLHAINQSYVGAFGSNAQGGSIYSTIGTSTIEFDYFHATDNWYDDDFTDTAFWLSIYPNVTLTIPEAEWNYAIPSPGTGIKLYMRKLSTAKVTLATSNLGTLSTPTLTGLSSGLYASNNYKMEINWTDHTISVWVNGTLVTDAVSFGTGLDASFGSTFRVLFHWHFYVMGPELRYIKNFTITQS